MIGLTACVEFFDCASAGAQTCLSGVESAWDMFALDGRCDGDNERDTDGDGVGILCCSCCGHWPCDAALLFVWVS